MEKAWKVTLYDTKARQHTTLLLRPVSRDVQLAHCLAGLGQLVKTSRLWIKRNTKLSDDSEKCEDERC